MDRATAAFLERLVALTGAHRAAPLGHDRRSAVNATMDQVINAGSGTTRHFYPAAAMVGDYLRTAAGLVPTGLLFATVPIGGAGAAVLGQRRGRFRDFWLADCAASRDKPGDDRERTAGHGISRQTIAWAELDRLKLAYYFDPARSQERLDAARTR